MSPLPVSLIRKCTRVSCSLFLTHTSMHAHVHMHTHTHSHSHSHTHTRTHSSTLHVFELSWPCVVFTESKIIPTTCLCVVLTERLHVLASFVVDADALSHNLRSASIARYGWGTHSYKDQHNRRPISHRKPFQLVLHGPLPHPKSPQTVFRAFWEALGPAKDTLRA